MNVKFKRTAYISNIYIFNIINVFTVTVDQFNSSFINKSTDLFYFFPPKIKF